MPTIVQHNHSDEPLICCPFPWTCRLMPAGVKLEWQLLNGPDIFLSVQRGSRNLGPGAEF